MNQQSSPRIRRAMLSFFAAVLSLLAVFIEPVHAAAVNHGYTPQAPAFDYAEARGRFTSQVNYSARRFNWGWQLSSSSMAGAAGLMSETAYLYCNGKQIASDSHAAIPVGYQLHASFPLAKPINSCNYQLWVHEVIPLRNGTRTVDLTFNFAVTFV